jgi:hypothetical protein
MSGRKLYEGESPKTQSFAAVKALITFYNLGEQPKEMPPFYRLSGDVVLVLSNKKDSYYVCTPKACSCPSATYRPGSPCKHVRKYFHQVKEATPERLFRIEESFKPTLPEAEAV